MKYSVSYVLNLAYEYEVVIVDDYNDVVFKLDQAYLDKEDVERAMSAPQVKNLVDYLNNSNFEIPQSKI